MINNATTIIFLIFFMCAGFSSAAPNPYDLYQETRQMNREPYGVQLQSYQVQIKNNLIEGILSYAEERRPAFFFPEPTVVSQLWQKGHPIFTRLEGKDAPSAIQELVGNFLLTSGQIFFYQVYGETDRESKKEIRQLRRNSRARLKEDKNTYRLVFTPRNELIETNVKYIGLVKLETSVSRIEVDIDKHSMVITRVLNLGEVKVSGTENDYQKPLNVIVELEYEKSGDDYLIKKIRSRPLEGDDFDYLVKYSYTKQDGFMLPQKIELTQTMVKDGKKKVIKVETSFFNYQLNKPFSPRAELEYKSFEELKTELDEIIKEKYR